MAVTPWIFWTGAGLSFLVVLGVLSRRPAGGGAACLAALAALAALFGPSFLVVGRKSWEFLELRQSGRGGAHWSGPGSFPVRPVAERLRFRLEAGGIFPPGPGEGRAGLPSWTSLGALLSMFSPSRREGAALLEVHSCPEGLEGADLPEGIPAWVGLAGFPERPKKEGRKAGPRLSAWIPRPPRAGRPWFFLVRSGPWKPGAPLELEFRLSGGNKVERKKGGPLSLRAGPGGVAFALLEGPPLGKGRKVLLLVCKGGGRSVQALVSFQVRPAPTVAVPDEGSLLASLLRAQGFRVLSWSGAGRLPSGTEILAWDRPGRAGPEEKRVLSLLDRGGGVLAVGEGLRGVASLPKLCPFLPVKPLAGELPGGKKGKASPRRERPEHPPKRLPPLPPPPEKPKKPPKKKLARTVSLVLVLDVSGSMVELLGVVRAACAATARAVDPKDRMGVIAFSDRAVTVVPLGPAGRQAGLLFRLNSLSATGSTKIWPALDLARKALDKEKTAVKAVLVFTDGMVEWGSGWGGSGKTLRVPETVAETAEDFRRRGISVSSIVYGGLGGDLASADFRFEGIRVLDALSRVTGGHIYMVKDPSKVVKAFLAEASRIAPGRKAGPGLEGGKSLEKPAPRKLLARKPPPPPSPPQRTLPKHPPGTHPSRASFPVHLAGRGWLTQGLPERLPPLGWLLPSLAKPEKSWVPLTAGKERFPLLALTPPLYARVAAWTSDAGGKGARSWVKARLLGGLLGRTVTALLPPAIPRKQGRARWGPSGKVLFLSLPGWPGKFSPRGRLLAEGGEKGGESFPLDWAGPTLARFHLDSRWQGKPVRLFPEGTGKGVAFLVPPAWDRARGVGAFGRKVGAFPPVHPPRPGLLSEEKEARPYLAVISALFLFLAVLSLAKFRKR